VLHGGNKQASQNEFHLPHTVLLYNRVLMLILAQVMVLIAVREKNPSASLWDCLRLQANGFRPLIELAYEILEKRYPLVGPNRLVRRIKDGLKILDGYFPPQAFRTVVLDEAHLAATICNGDVLSSSGTCRGLLQTSKIDTGTQHAANLNQLRTGQMLRSDLSHLMQLHVHEIQTINSLAGDVRHDLLCHLVKRSLEAFREILCLLFA
jgi:hypothetical protein